MKSTTPPCRKLPRAHEAVDEVSERSADHDADQDGGDLRLIRRR